MEEEPCVYGVKRAVATWNPIKINIQHIWQLTQDAWHAESWWDKCRLWLMPSGWRPADVEKKYPVKYTIDPFKQVKYDTPASKALHAWSWFQYATVTLLMLHMLFVIAKISPLELFLYGGFLFWMIYSYTSLMDRDPNAIWMELIKSIFGFGIIYFTGDWFMINDWMPSGLVMITTYLILSVLIVAAFVLVELKSDKQEIMKMTN